MIVLATTVFAQKTVQNLPTFDKQRIHFGFYIGTNMMNFNIEHSGEIFTDPANGREYQLFGDLSALNPGFHVGLVSSLRLGEYFNLRLLPGISFGQRDTEFTRYYLDTEELVQIDDPIPVKSTFIELPIIFKYKAVRDGNARPYLIAGSTVRLDLARSKREDVVLNPFDVALDFGVGSDFYFDFFRFGLEARISIGMMDILWHDRPAGDYNPNYINAIDRLTSNMFIISLNFE